MNAKLTLKLSAVVISRAKDYAKRRKTSLSKLVESYLDAITREEEGVLITPLVKRLSGVLELPEDFDYRKERMEELQKKQK
jgi:hypothetical protein